MVNQQFTFVYYIINKYLTFPVFSLLNMYGIFVWLISRTKTNKLDQNYELRSMTMNYPKEMAYTTHMFVIGIIFSITAPITNLVIFVTYFMFAAIDRYFILYVYKPEVYHDLSSQARMMLDVIQTISLGLFFMLVATACYFLVRNGPIYTFGIVVCLLCFIGSLLFKFNIDKQYKKALCELARGQFDDTAQLLINPAHVFSSYDEKDMYHTVYDADNPEDIKMLNEKLKRPADKPYKMSFMDKCLSRFYIDLSALPVSVIRTTSAKSSDQILKVLPEEALQMYRLDCPDMISEEERKHHVHNMKQVTRRVDHKFNRIQTLKYELDEATVQRSDVVSPEVCTIMK